MTDVATSTSPAAHFIATCMNNPPTSSSTATTARPSTPRRTNGTSSHPRRPRHTDLAPPSRIDDDDTHSNASVAPKRDNRQGKGKAPHRQSSSSDSQQRPERSRPARSESGKQKANPTPPGPRVSKNRDSEAGTSNRRSRTHPRNNPDQTSTSATPIADQTVVPSQSNRSPRTTTTRRNTTRTATGALRRADECRNLMETLTVGLTNSTYDCMVCWDTIRPAHKIWSCQVCWAAFHIGCLSTWAKMSSSDPNNHGDGWRCPGCQNTQVSIPKEYRCYCGKVHEPEFNRYFTPHSCGELCGRARDCPHPCNIPCHPGPCPPCGGLGPLQSCHCGNQTFQLRCSDTDYSSNTGKSCDQVCGELLGCRKHTCNSVCHPDLCPPCEEEEIQKCYCGKHERKARCGEGIPKATLVNDAEELGFFDCHDICRRPLACGNHECSKSCHPIDREPGLCPARPEVVKTCPCGSKTIDILLDGGQRTSCTDPIPVCAGVCKKSLECGHRCMQKCHTGDCAPCKTVTMVSCRCGSTHVQRVCSNMTLYGHKEPTCEKPCGGLRSCGRHQCTQRCCPAKNQSKGPKKEGASHEAHACTLVCGKKLKCGVHTCEQPCHKGHCRPCLNASFDELSCACGRTVLNPPIACGTTIPKCRYTCTRPRTCGHASFSTHPCHPDSEPCPPCTIQVPKDCMCQKTTMPSVPCYMAHPSCGKVCGKALGCGVHKCTKSCHSDECTPSSEVCTQLCLRARKSCGHRCSATCHGREPCPEDTPCQVLVMSGCKCGHLAKEVPCNASAENPWDRKSRTIKCNDYCLIAERNKRVATAFGIDPDATRSPRIPQYDNHVLEYALDNMEFTLKMEKRLADWVADTSVQVLNLPPMKGHHRKFVHELVAHYNVASESVDVEPYRSVVIHRKLNTSVPDLLASQACRQKRVAISPSLAAAGGVEQLRKSVVKEPVNAIYLHDLADGLMRGQLITQLAPVFGNIKYGIRWLTDDDAVLVPHPGNMTMDELEVVLIRLRTGIKALTSQGQICERAELCWVNRDGDVTGHTNAGSKRYFNAAQGSQLMKKAGPAKVENTFALLDDEERVTAARRAEEERILRAKEAAGTLSLEAWEEDAANTSFPSSYAWTSRPSSVEYADHSDHSSSSRSPSSPRKVKKEESNDDVVDDWQELLDDN